VQHTQTHTHTCAAQVEKKTFAEEVNAAFREYAAGPMKGVLAVNDEPLVSADFKGMDASTSIDSSLTMVMGDDMVKVVAWVSAAPASRPPCSCAVAAAAAVAAATPPDCTFACSMQPCLCASLHLCPPHTQHIY